MGEVGAEADSVVVRPGPYRHGVVPVAVLARLADAACEGVDDPHTAALRVPKLAGQHEPPIGRSAVTVMRDTFLYVIRTAPVDAHPEAGLEPLDGRSPLPPPLREAGEDVRALWLDLAYQVTHPVAQARCWDIVFTLGLIRNKRDAAERAASAYLAAASTTLAPRHRANGLVRGWNLARKVGLTGLEGEITGAMRTVVADALDEVSHPWAVIPLLAVLIAPAPRGKAVVSADPGIDQLLSRALDTYDEVDVVADIATLVRKHAAGDRDRIERANRRQIGLMLAAARAATEPMVIRKLFADAASAARRLGVADMEKTAVAGLQAAPALNWQTFGFEVTLPAAYFDLYLPGFDAAADWREALAIWLNTEAPSGRWEANQKNTRRVQHASAIRYLVSTVEFRDDDLPVRTMLGEEEIFKRDLAQAEAMQMGARGVFLGNALYMIASRFGIPPLEEVEAFLLTSEGDPALVRALAEALELFWVGKYTASAHLAVPKIEAAVRGLLLELDEPLYRTQTGDTPGQFPGLGSLLPGLLSNDFDPDWERFLRTLLLSDGNNIRNLLAHGFTGTVHPVDAALVLRACAVVVLLTNPQAVARDTALVRARLAVPIGPQPRRRLWQRLAAAAQAARFELRW